MWYSGTGGGLGDKSLFETWSDEKLTKYDINIDNYDHCDISDKPSILFDGYSKRKKYLTIIFLWDELTDMLLCSKYDPFKMGKGEAGFRQDSESASHTEQDDASISGLSATSDKKWKNRRKRIKEHQTDQAKQNADQMAHVVKTVIDLVNGGDKKIAEVEKVIDGKNSSLAIENQSLDQLLSLMEYHKSYLKLLQDNDMCTPDEKESVFAEIKAIWNIIRNRRGGGEKRTLDDIADGTSVS